MVTILFNFFKNSLMIFAIITFQKVTAQIKAEDFGFRHFQYFIEGDSIDVLVKSKKGDENKKKPIFFQFKVP